LVWAEHATPGLRPANFGAQASLDDKRSDMSAKEVLYTANARKRMLAGSTHRQCLKVRSDPGGRNVVLAKSYGLRRSQRRRERPKEIELEDRFENMGAQMVREVASKTPPT